MTELKEGHVYFVDGGYFSAKYDAILACWRLWTYAGLAGSVVSRTGFEVTKDGQLQHRIYDVSAEEFILFASGLSVADLEEVSLNELQQIDVEKVILNRQKSASSQSTRGKSVDTEDVF